MILSGEICKFAVLHAVQAVSRIACLAMRCNNVRGGGDNCERGRIGEVDAFLDVARGTTVRAGREVPQGALRALTSQAARLNGTIRKDSSGKLQ